MSSAESEARPYAIVAGDFVQTGGMDVANHALAMHLLDRGRSVDLVAYRVADDLARRGSVRVHTVPKPGGAYALGAPVLGAMGLAVASAVARRGGRVVVNGGNCAFPAANWVHYVHAAYRPSYRGSRWHVAKAHAMHWIHVASERAALRVAKLVLTNSDRTRFDVIEGVGIAPERVRTVYYGTDATRFRPASEAERGEARRLLEWDDDRPRVVFVGALGDRRKGFDVVYDAWRELCRQASWDADLVVVGTGAELPRWKARAERDGLSKRVRFLGFRRDVPTVLAASDALISPTRYEAYGLGVHEALCCGLPAVVSARAGVAERYPASLESLLLPDPASAGEVVSALTRWRENVAALRREVATFSVGLRGRSWSDMGRDIVAACDALVDR